MYFSANCASGLDICLGIESWEQEVSLSAKSYIDKAKVGFKEIQFFYGIVLCTYNFTFQLLREKTLTLSAPGL